MKTTIIKTDTVIRTWLLFFLIATSLLHAVPMERGENTGLRNRFNRDGANAQRIDDDQRGTELRGWLSNQERDPAPGIADDSVPLQPQEGVEGAGRETPFDLSLEALSQKLIRANKARDFWMEQLEHPTAASVEKARRAIDYWNQERVRYENAAMDPENSNSLEEVIDACSQAQEAAQQLVDGDAESNELALQLKEVIIQENGRFQKENDNNPAYEKMILFWQWRKNSLKEIETAASIVSEELSVKEALKREIEENAERHRTIEQNVTIWNRCFLIVQPALDCFFHSVVPRFVSNAAYPAFELFKEILHDSSRVRSTVKAMSEHHLSNPKDRLRWMEEECQMSRQILDELLSYHGKLSECLRRSEDELLEELERRIRLCLGQLSRQIITINTRSVITKLIQHSERLPLLQQNRLIDFRGLKQNYDKLEQEYDEKENTFRAAKESETITSEALKTAKSDLEKIKVRRNKLSHSSHVLRAHEIESRSQELGHLDNELSNAESSVKNLEKELSEISASKQKKELEAIVASYKKEVVAQEYKWADRQKSKVTEVLRDGNVSATQQTVPPASTSFSNFKRRWIRCSAALDLFKEHPSLKSAQQVRAEIKKFLDGSLNRIADEADIPDKFFQWNPFENQIEYGDLYESSKEAYDHFLTSMYHASLVVERKGVSDCGIIGDVIEGANIGRRRGLFFGAISGGFFGACAAGPVGFLGGFVLGLAGGAALGVGGGILVGSVVTPLKRAITSPVDPARTAAESANIAARNTVGIGIRKHEEAQWIADRAQEIAAFAEIVKNLNLSSVHTTDVHAP